MSVSDDLDALYAEVPDPECKGLCIDSCGPIVASAAEAGRMFKASGGVPLGMDEDAHCSYLDGRGRCSVYSVRPLICRLFGAVDDRLMRCEFGCAPAKPLTNAEARALLRRSREIGGPAVDGLGLRTVADAFKIIEEEGLRRAQWR